MDEMVKSEAPVMPPAPGSAERVEARLTALLEA